MAISNHERVGKALELLKDGLQPFVERELKQEHQQHWFEGTQEFSFVAAALVCGNGGGPKVGCCLGPESNVGPMAQGVP